MAYKFDSFPQHWLTL